MMSERPKDRLAKRIRTEQEYHPAFRRHFTVSKWSRRIQKWRFRVTEMLLLDLREIIVLFVLQKLDMYEKDVVRGHGGSLSSILGQMGRTVFVAL